MIPRHHSHQENSHSLPYCQIQGSLFGSINIDFVFGC